MAFPHPKSYANCPLLKNDDYVLDIELSFPGLIF